MKCKSAYLIINPRSGETVAKLTDVLAVLAAAGWKTDIALKEFGGHPMQLAREAAEAGYDLVIAYGGDGTFNQVINGVMAAGHRRCIAGLIPGGTANVWAHEIGMPEDPVTAALQLINSTARKVDLGHVQVDPLSVGPGMTDRQRPQRLASGGRHHFLLMAGLGTDAAILRRVSSGLKEGLGEAAVALAAVKELPTHHPFPIEIRSWGAGTEEGVVWRGNALQVIIGNTRRYGNIDDVTPAAYIDDGVLDLCVITAGAPLTTIQQLLSFLLHRDASHGCSEYIQGAHFGVTAPASIALQLDGSQVKLKDQLLGPDRTAYRQAGNPDSLMVTYRFDALPRALRVAVPSTYDDALFEEGAGRAGIAAVESADVRSCQGLVVRVRAVAGLRGARSAAQAGAEGHGGRGGPGSGGGRNLHRRR
jgi:YegS/Rv2252/BmrU family lipid kinase